MRRPHDRLVPPDEVLRERIAVLRRRVTACMIWERVGLARRLDAALRGDAAGHELARRVEQLALLVERSEATARARRAGVPTPVYPPDLPVVARREEILKTLSEHRVVVVCGETGSGKSTQLPKLCLELGCGVFGMIGHTQPRRIAARSVAARVAEELGTGLGQAVGYKIRFGEQVGPRTLIKVLTDGMLLAETQTDRLLERYDTLIIDEAHERSLNIDFLLGYLRRVLEVRRDLRVIVTSATIDPQRFSRHFGNCPIIEVSGRTYPVEVRYRPMGPSGEAFAADDDTREDALEHGVVSAVAELARAEDREVARGDVLVFLPGEREIRETAELIAQAGPGRTGGPVEVLPLYARLSGAEQQRIFSTRPAGGVRRVVLATNVAETSLTVPGIRSVIDTGEARISRYSFRTRVQRLPIEPVSQASAQQRAGRCGRLGPGVCVRLYSEQDWAARPAFTEPEILRTNLAGVILQMKALRLGEPESFPFVEAPEGRMIRDGYDTLRELGALDEAGSLTTLGEQMARLPVDPRIARMLLAGRDEQCLGEMLVICAALSVQDPRERGGPDAQAADAVHAKYVDEQSDFVSFLNLWRATRDPDHRGALAGGRLRRLCAQERLSYVRVREWHDVHRQLGEMAAELGVARAGDEVLAARAVPYERVHAAVLTGLLPNIGRKHQAGAAGAGGGAGPSGSGSGGGGGGGGGLAAGEYQGTRGNKFAIFPGSGLFRRGPQWVVAAEIVQTTRTYARCVASVQPGWIERVGAHLVKRSHGQEHWDERTQRVIALERGTLLGVELYCQRRVDFGRIDPVKAREVFILHALVEGELRSDAAFLSRNAAMLKKVRTLEAKLRRGDLLADAARRFAFFDERVPPQVCSGATFERWRAQAGDADDWLCYREQDVMAQGVPEDVAANYPDQVQSGSVQVPLRYLAEPGHADDGVTALVPLEALPRVDPRAGERLVPGLLAEKLEALIRSLPKAYRVNFVPAPDFAARAAKVMGREGSLPEALSRALEQLTGVRVPPGEFRVHELPEHLRMNYHVVDARSQVLGAGRDLASLRAQLAERVHAALRALAPEAYNRADVRSWDFGDLPESVEIAPVGARGADGQAGAVRAWPALVAEGESGVALRACPTPDEARRLHPGGVRRLYARVARDELDRGLRRARGAERLRLLWATFGAGADLRQAVFERACGRVFLPELAAAGPEGAVCGVRTAREFESRLRGGLGALGRVVEEVTGLLLTVLNAAQEAQRTVEDVRNPRAALAMVDIRAQLERLLARDTLAGAGDEQLAHYPRYLAAVQVRARKLIDGRIDEDLRAMQALAPHRDRLASLRVADTPTPAVLSSVEAYRWMLEEFRVSLFAQGLGTSVPVSPQRLDRQWAKVESAAGAARAEA